MRESSGPARPDRDPFGDWTDVAFFLTVIAGAAVSFGFSDLDIKLLGIGRHRNFLFHSAIVPAIVLCVLRPRSRSLSGFLAAACCCAFCLGVGAHLVTDVFQTASVRFPIVGSLVDDTSIDDRLWEGTNAVACALLAWRSYGRWRERREKT